MSRSAIDQYLLQATPSQQKILQHIRSLVHAKVPESQEVIAYGIPTFKYKGHNLIHFAAFKDHMSLFPTAQPIAELKGKLGPYTTGKGTLQFTEDNVIPDHLINEIVDFRLAVINSK